MSARPAAARSARRLAVATVVGASAIGLSGCCGVGAFGIGSECPTARLAGGAKPSPATAGEPVKIGAHVRVRKPGLNEYPEELGLQHGVHFDFDGNGRTDQLAYPQLDTEGAVSVSHVFTTPGLHTVRFTTWYRFGEPYNVVVRATGKTEVIVRGEPAPSAPVAQFTAPAFASVGRPVIFDASGSHDPDGGAIVTYRWTFGDGSRMDTAGPIATHEFQRPGMEVVRLEVVDDEGVHSDPVRRGITVQLSASASSEARAAGRAFTARLRGLRIGPAGGLVKGRFRGRLAGHSRPGDRDLRRLLRASWRARLNVSVDRRSAGATVNGLALAKIRGPAGGRACLRVRMRQPTFGPARGTMVLLGGSGAAADLRVRATFAVGERRSGAVRVAGRLRAGRGEPRGLRAGCRGLA